jgi:hypothetical protein
VINSKAHGKCEAEAGPVLLDPQDGTNRTPKPLAFSGTVQLPAKHLNSLFAVEETPSHANVASELESTLPLYPRLLSFGSISNVGTATPAASDAGEDEAQQKNVDAAGAAIAVCNQLFR